MRDVHKKSMFRMLFALSAVAFLFLLSCASASAEALDEEPFDWYFWFLMFTAAVLAIVAFFVLRAVVCEFRKGIGATGGDLGVVRLKSKPKEPLKDTKTKSGIALVAAPRENDFVEKLDRFIEQEELLGKGQAEIKKELVDAGWPAGFSESEIKKTHSQEQEHARQLLKPAQDYIKKRLSCGDDRAEIKRSLLEAGWPERLVDNELLKLQNK